VRRAVAVLACATAAAFCGVNGASARVRPAEAPQTSDLLVYAQEWSLWPSRRAVPAGRVAVELWNRGQDAHDLRVRRLGASGRMVGPVLGSVATTQPGQILKATWRLRSPGHYEVYCSLPGHLKLGMEARLTVTPDHG
jgi:plastocyanin